MAAFGMSIHRFGTFAIGAVALASLGACSKPAATTSSESTTTQTTPADNSAATTTTTATTTNTSATAPATTTAAAGPAPAADSTDTVGGQKLASYTGDEKSGKVVFLQCQACHSIDEGKNMIGPSLHAVVGRHSGTIAGFAYSPANKNSNITWTQEKLFQYLEHPQRVVPGTKMTFTGVADPQKRADVIAYLKSNS